MSESKPGHRTSNVSGRNSSHPSGSVEDDLQVLGKGAGWTGIWTVLGYALSVLGGLLIARLVGAAVLGSVMVGVSIMTLAQVIVTLGMDRGVLKFVSLDLGQTGGGNSRNLLRFALGTSAAAWLLLGFVYLAWVRPHIPTLLPEVRGVRLVADVFMGLTPVAASLVITVNGLTALQNPQGGQFANGIVRPAVQLAALLILMSLLPDLPALAWATVIAYGVAASVGLVRFGMLTQPMGAAETEGLGVEATTFLKFSATLMVIPLLNFAGQQADVLLVGHFLADTSAGVYSVVKRLGLLAVVPLVVLGGVTAATVSKRWGHDDHAGIQRIYHFSTKWITVLSAALALTFMNVPEELLALFGGEFVIGAAALQIMAIAQFVNAAVGPSGNTLLMVGHERLVLLNSIIAAMLGLGGAWYLIPTFEIVGAAIAIGGAVAIVNLLSALELVFAARITPASLRMAIERTLALLLSLVATFMTADVAGHPIVQIALTGLVSVGSVLTLTLLIEGVGPDDMVVFRALTPPPILDFIQRMGR